MKGVEAGLCEKCTREARKTPTKQCESCSLILPVTAFSHRNICVICVNKIQQAKRAANPEIRKVEHDKAKAERKNKSEKTILLDRKTRCRRLGLKDEIDKIIPLFDTQKECLICKNPCDQLCIDHDHATGKFRGLICTRCNHGLGHFKDNIDTLLEAIEYLKKSRS